LPINTFASGGTYYLEDHTRDTATYDSQNSRLSFRTQRFTDTDDFWDSSRQYAAIDAQYGVNQTYDYFKTIHNRVGIDGQGGPKPSTSIDGTTSLITSRVHYGKRYNNAFWNGQQMTYGDGDGQLFSPLTSLDIAGHEMTHGVTEFTANLVYADESGALNESISDVFGALVERYSKGESSNTWKIGEDVYNPSVPGDALRYMDNPHAANDNGYTANDDPDHYSERYQGSQDNGGVHVNSGIANYVFYLLAQGGTHHLGGSMSGIGADAAGDIWYTALTNYMTSSTNFQQARQATIAAASALYGVSSAQANAVAQAWSLCGVS
jgi:thermolysin